MTFACQRWHTRAGSRAGSILVLFALFFAASSAVAEEFSLFKSTDQGRTWTRSDAGLPRNSRINALGRLDGTLFAGTDSGIFLSLDSARTWKQAVLPASSRRVISFATTGSKVFAGTDGSGLLISSDEGRSWTNVSFGPRKVRSLLAHGGKVYAGTDSEGVFVSTNAGHGWTPLQPGLPEPSQVFALAAVKDSLFAGLYSKGLYGWTAQEQRWTRIGRLKPLVLASAGGTLIAGHNPGSLFWSDDAGASWARGEAASATLVKSFANELGELSDDTPVWEMAANDKLALAGASSGIYFSENRGRTWTRATTGLPPSSPGVAFLVSDDVALAAILVNGSKGGISNQ